MERDLRKPADPCPTLPIHARIDTQDGSIICYEQGPGLGFLIVDEEGTPMFEAGHDTGSEHLREILVDFAANA